MDRSAEQLEDVITTTTVEFKGGQQQTDEKSKSTFEIPTIPSWDIPHALRHEYYQILNEPKRLPFFIHPFFGKDREISLHGSRTFFSPVIYLNDEHKVARRFFFNFDVGNLGVGTAGGLLVGLGTQHYFQMHGRLARMSAQQWLKNIKSGNATALERFAVGSVISWRVAKRAAVGAILFDGLKRNAELKRDKDDWMNSAFAGAICGGAFGLRGGFQTGLFSCIGYSICAALYHLSPGFDSVT